jgi:lysophospholipase L1-like esterase
VACLECASAVGTRLVPDTIAAQLRPVRERERQLDETLEQMLQDPPDTLAVFDAALGWRPRPGLDKGTDVIDSRGLRSSREYATSPPAQTFRIAAFGDSFVYGSEVRGEEAWPAQLERIGHGLEVLNFGVPGYGPDQAYLRFLAEVESVHPHAAIFAIATPALLRIVTVSAAFQAEKPHFLAKPRFELDAAGELVLLANPLQKREDLRRFLHNPAAVRALGAHDYWYEPLVYENPVYDYSYTVRLAVALWEKVWRRYLDPERPVVGGRGAGAMNASSRAFAILTRLIESFRRDAQERSIQPIVLLLPDGYSVLQSRAGKGGILDPLARWCAEQGIECLDATQAFEALGAEPERGFVNRFHYSAEGNASIARWLAEALDRLRSEPSLRSPLDGTGRAAPDRGDQLPDARADRRMPAQPRS